MKSEQMTNYPKLPKTRLYNLPAARAGFSRMETEGNFGPPFSNT